eukprot:Phypoly_transcript_11171.p1 GENE.Phypoly_transcript_11171~~Phypoly_transcript_11171.p1  ORF type:complete len:380 (+),score=49.83 Phypoly_transcript_11171:45-1184(+)
MEDPKTRKVAVVMGPTGSGKSALCNIMAGSILFTESPDLSSCTYQTSIHTSNWMNSGQKTMIVDTPGHGDSAGRDTEHIRAMVESLKSIQYASVFVILFNGQSPRYDESLQSMLKTVVQIFGPEFFKHTILAFSRWGFDAVSKAQRSMNNETEAQRSTEYSNFIRNQFNLNFDIPSFFYEREYAHPVNGIDHAEIAEYKGQTAKLTQFLQSKTTNCDMRGLVAIQAEKDRLRIAAEQAEAERKRQEAIAAEQRRQAEIQRQAAEQQRRAAEQAAQARAQAEAQRRAAEQAARDAYNNSIVSSSLETQEVAVGGQYRQETSRKTRWHGFGQRDTVWWQVIQRYDIQQRTKNVRGDGRVEYTGWGTVRVDNRVVGNGSHHE